MSAATATPADAAPAAKSGKKKLLIIIVAAVLLLVLGGGGAVLLMKKKSADGQDGDDGEGHASAPAHEPAVKAKPRREPGQPPVFLPLDPFTVNLADRDTERYAQIGVTLEIDDAKTGDEIKLYMPAIRNNILMVLSHKTATQLLSREGKDKLAQSILYASVRPLGYDVDDEEDDEEDAAADTAPKKKKKKKRAPPSLPVSAVHFSNFIVQ